MAKLYNLARMSTPTTGTGTITLGSPISGFLSFAAAGVSDGETISYGISDGANSEKSEGVYTASGTTLTRVVKTSTNSNTAINLSGSAQVFITPGKEDIANLNEANTWTAAQSFTAVTASAAILSTSPTAGIGYATGAGGTVTQATSKSTGVTINKTTGLITTSNAALAAGAGVAFTVTNSSVAATDLILLNMNSGPALQNSYSLIPALVIAGQFAVIITNVSAGSLSEALVIRFAVIKSVNT